MIFLLYHNMATKYSQADEATKRLITVLKEGKSLEQSGYDESLFHLLSAGFSQIVSLNQAQAEVIQRLVPEGREDDPQVRSAQEMLSQAKTVLGEINLSLLQTQKKTSGQDEISSSKDNIVEFYDYKAPEHNISKIKDSEIRPVPQFSGVPEPNLSIDVSMENFLISLNNTAQQLGLSEKGLVWATLSKLTGAASQIVRSRIMSLNLTSENIPFHTLQKILENSFMAQSDPQSALKALMSLTPLNEGTCDFLLLESTIMRLSRLSLKQHQNEVEKNCLMQSRAKEQFLRLIPPSAKKKIQQKNLARIEQGLSEMGLHTMANYLLETQRIEHPQANTLPPILNSTVISRAVQNEQNSENDEMGINWVQKNGPGTKNVQGNKNATFAPRRPPNGPSNNYKGPKMAPRGPQTQNARNFPQNRYTRPFPEAPFPPKNAKPAPKGGYQRRSPPDKNGPPPYKWSHEELGIAKNTCFSCGQPKKYCKGYWDPQCPYSGSPMCKTRCRAPQCSGGAHKSSFCLGQIHNAVAALKKQQNSEKASKQANLVQEGTSDFEEVDPFQELEDQDDDFFDLNM